MTKPEVKSLYTEAAVRARCAPNASELAIWVSQLGAADIRDLKAAIDAHFEKSSWMPKESELKPLMEQARQARTAAGYALRSTYVRWQCPDHPAVIVAGFVEPLDFRARRCPKAIRDTNHPDGPVRCAAKMNEIFRQNNFETGNRSVADVPVREAVA